MAIESYADIHEKVVSRMRKNFREYVPTGNEKDKIRREIERLKNREAELSYALKHIDEAYLAIKNDKFEEFLKKAITPESEDEKSSSKTKTEERNSKSQVPITLANGKTIYESYKRDKEFMDEKLGVFEIPRWQIVEGKFLENKPRESLKTEAERKYYDYVKEQMKNVDRDLKIPSSYKFQEDLKLKNDKGNLEYTARIKGDFESAEGKKVLKGLTELAEEVGGKLQNSSSKMASFYFGEKTKMMDGFKETVKLYRDSEKEKVSSAENINSQIENDGKEESGTYTHKKETAAENQRNKKYAEVDEHLTWIKENKFAYDENKSVEENISAAEEIAQEYLDKFGITADINTEERISLRRQIIEELYGNGAQKKESKAFLIMGLPASGKSTIAETVAKENGALIIDSDMAKEKLPEYNGGILANAVHDESTLIAAKVRDLAILNNDNMVLPIVGSYESDVQQLIDGLKNAGY